MNNASAVLNEPSSQSMLILASNDLISNQSLHIFVWIFYAGLTLFIDVFGTMTNIINIVCFIKQGFRDIVNISLM
ncbi:unnamed protein product, partial [Candidula unifasciata]